MIFAVFRRAFLVTVAIGLTFLTEGAAPASEQAEAGLVLVCMPDQDPVDHPPSDGEILAYLRQHESLLDISIAELTADPRREFARRVLGQEQVFRELEEFRTRYGVRVNARFVAWPDAFRYLDDYVADPGNPPIVAQIGDTWAAYFRSLGVAPHQQRHTLDVRLLWYWKDLVQPEDIAEGTAFTETCRRLRNAGDTGIAAPFAISTAPDWDLLHNLAIWLYNAGLQDLVVSDRKLGVLPWTEAVFARQEGQQAAEFLMHLAEQGFVDLSEHTNVEVLEAFLDRKYAMIIMGPWVPWRAEKHLGADWQASIGATLPPTIGRDRAVTFEGGSLMVVLDPSRVGPRPTSRMPPAWWISYAPRRSSGLMLRPSPPSPANPKPWKHHATGAFSRPPWSVESGTPPSPNGHPSSRITPRGIASTPSGKGCPRFRAPTAGDRKKTKKHESG